MTGFLNGEVVGMPIWFRKNTFLYTWAMGSFLEMQLKISLSQFSSEKAWNSLIGEGQKM